MSNGWKTLISFSAQIEHKAQMPLNTPSSKQRQVVSVINLQ